MSTRAKGERTRTWVLSSKFKISFNRSLKERNRISAIQLRPTQPPLSTPSSTKSDHPITKHQGQSKQQAQHRAESTKHQTPSTKHQAPSTKHQAPSTKHQAPSTKHQAPSTKQAPSSNLHLQVPRSSCLERTI